jgi:hypothetical protein
MGNSHLYPLKGTSYFYAVKLKKIMDKQIKFGSKVSFYLKKLTRIYEYY